MAYSSVRPVVRQAQRRANSATRGGFGTLELLESRQLMSALPPVGPSATLRADAITSEQSGSYTFKVIYTDPDGLASDSFDDGDLRVTGQKAGFDRAARFMSAAVDPNSNGHTWVVRYKVGAPTSGAGWNELADGYYTISLRNAEVSDTSGNFAMEGIVGQFVCAIGDVAAGSGGSNLVTTTQGVNVASFGAKPNDSIDDTTAIQNAINALPLGDGSSTASATTGGIVQLGVGTYIINRPLTVPSGVVLRGAGGATGIKNVSTDRRSATIRLVSPYSHGCNIGAGVQDLNIYTTYAAGIRADALPGHLDDMVLQNLHISAGGAAIDLRQVETYHAQIQNIIVTNPGSTALWIGNETTWRSAVNRIEGFRVIGSARANFVAEKALIVLAGDTTVIGGAIEETYAHVLPLYVRGSTSISGLWTEYPTGYAPDKTLAWFDHCAYVSIDRLVNIDSNHRLKLTESKAVTVGILAIEGIGDAVRDTVIVDGHSHLTVDTVYAQRDSGGFDDPRLTVRQAYNILDEQMVQNRTPAPGENLLTDPSFKTFGKANSPWSVQFGDTLGAVTGTAVVEQTASGPRLKVVVTSNPSNRPVSIFVNFTTPLASVGKRGVATWRLDGKYAAQVFTRDAIAAYSAAAMNTMTGARSPIALRRNEGMMFMLNSAKGTYYLSKVGMVADAA